MSDVKRGQKLAADIKKQTTRGEELKGKLYPTKQTTAPKKHTSKKTVATPGQ